LRFVFMTSSQSLSFNLAQRPTLVITAILKRI
jgi:hypothetical protein